MQEFIRNRTPIRLKKSGNESEDSYDTEYDGTVEAINGDLQDSVAGCHWYVKQYIPYIDDLQIVGNIAIQQSFVDFGARFICKMIKFEYNPFTVHKQLWYYLIYFT